MSSMNVDPEALRTMAGRQHDNADITDEWARPNEQLVREILATHGPQAAELVDSLCDYYEARHDYGTVHANNFRETGDALLTAAASYTGTDTNAAGSFTSSPASSA